jgi:hypothetical protein
MLAPEQIDDLVVDDLDEHLSGRDRLEDGLADGLLADAIEEGAHHRERDVRIEQRETDLAEALLDVGFGELALPA